MKRPKIKVPPMRVPHCDGRSIGMLQSTCLLFTIVIIGVVSIGPAPVDKPEPVAEAKVDDRGWFERKVDWTTKWGGKIAKLAPLAGVL